MPKTPQPPAAAPQGTVRERVEPPEVVGDISVAEAQEIKERKRLIEAAVDKFKEGQDRLNDEAKVITLLRSENRMFLEGLLRAHSLDASDDYNIDSDLGRIVRVARAINTPPVVETTEEAEPVEAEPNGAK
jgi:hypothetical protein